MVTKAGLLDLLDEGPPPLTSNLSKDYALQMAVQLEVSDPKAMRALAHPLRLSILDVLRDRGQATATEVATQLGDSAANCSFHLRTLERYGFVEDVGGGKGRHRPWRAIPYHFAIDSTEASSDMLRAAQALGEAAGDKTIKRLEGWESETASHAEVWQSAAFHIDNRLRVTPSELKKIRTEMQKILKPYRSREKLPSGAIEAVVAAWGFPSQQTESANQMSSRDSKHSAG